MRQINSHKVNPANDQIDIQCHDEPGHGGACHEYSVVVPMAGRFDINFQNGPIAEAGVNGLTHEALLAIIEDRLEHFQRGPYACHENAMALESVRAAQEWLQTRTKRRMERGVEGTHAV